MPKQAIRIACRIIAILFFIAAFVQWLSYNSPTVEQSMLSNVAGWIFTVIIAAPGLFLWAFSNKNNP